MPKRGDKNSEGLIYWHGRKTTGYQQWITQEEFSRKVEKSRQSIRKYQINNRDKKLASDRKAHKKMRDLYPDRVKNRVLKYSYGITFETYNEMYSFQSGVCAICNLSCSTGRKLCVDHDHKTGKVRGLLCNDCNIGIGKLKDSSKILKKASDYLDKYFSLHSEEK
jgi:hypothetical protein